MTQSSKNARRSDTLRELAIHCHEHAAEAVADLLERILREPPVTLVDEDTRRTVVSVYPRPGPAPDEDSLLALRTGMRSIQEAGLGPCRFESRAIREEDWAESWKRHFPPMSIGSSLLIRPSWSRRKPRGQQALIVLDPGLAFGTGQHPTTEFCLRQLVTFGKRHPGASFLDMGTGSGILAIAAAKLGYSPVDAFDFDPVCIRVARLNARRNRVGPAIRFARRDLTRMPDRSRRRYDLVCANLIYDLLVAERDRILARLSRQGRLILAGILGTQFPAVRRAFEQRGMQLVEEKVEKEWHSGAFTVGTG